MEQTKHLIKGYSREYKIETLLFVQGESYQETTEMNSNEWVRLVSLGFGTESVFLIRQSCVIRSQVGEVCSDIEPVVGKAVCCMNGVVGRSGVAGRDNRVRNLQARCRPIPTIVRYNIYTCGQLVALPISLSFELYVRQ